MAVSDFNTPTKRAKLQPKAEPYWFKVSKGRFIGYRRGKNRGAWVARAGKRIATIGEDGKGEMSDPETAYDVALVAVIKWCEREDTGVNRKYTLDQCIADYVTDLQRRKTAGVAHKAEVRLRHSVPDTMLSTEVSKLTMAAIEDWFKTHKTDPMTGEALLTTDVFQDADMLSKCKQHVCKSVSVRPIGGRGGRGIGRMEQGGRGGRGGRGRRGGRG